MKITSSTIENKFIKIKTLDMGASLFEVYLKSKKTNLILNLGSKKNYIVKNGCVGATCGRFAGRISGAKFSIDREKFEVINFFNHGIRKDKPSSSGLTIVRRK